MVNHKLLRQMYRKRGWRRSWRERIELNWGRRGRGHFIRDPGFGYLRRCKLFQVSWVDPLMMIHVAEISWVLSVR